MIFITVKPLATRTSEESNSSRKSPRLSRHMVSESTSPEFVIIN